jgi:hypothetical protein
MNDSNSEPADLRNARRRAPHNHNPELDRLPPHSPEAEQGAARVDFEKSFDNRTHRAIIPACHSSINLPLLLNSTRSLCAFPRTVTHRSGGVSSIGVTMNYTPQDHNFTKRFWLRISKSSPDECWPWQASKKRDGYGQVKYEGKMQLAHRIAYRLSFGEIPKGKLVCHHCDNPPCCNPSHLFIGTDADNRRDMVQKGRERHANGSRIRRAKFTESQVLEIRKSHIPFVHSARAISEKLGVHKSCIEKILQRVTWQHIP